MALRTGALRRTSSCEHATTAAAFAQQPFLAAADAVEFCRGSVRGQPVIGQVVERRPAGGPGEVRGARDH